MFYVLSMCILATITGSPARAADSSKYMIAGKEYELRLLLNARVLISSSCVKDGKLQTCGAHLLIERASFKKYAVSHAGGAEPGAALCRKLGGKVVVGVDSARNQEGFCQSDDGTLVSTDALHYHARANDQKSSTHE